MANAGIYGNTPAQIQAQLGALPGGSSGALQALQSLGGGVTPGVTSGGGGAAQSGGLSGGAPSGPLFLDLLNLLRQSQGLGSMNPAGTPVSQIVDQGGADPFKQYQEGQSQAQNDLIANGIGTAISVAASLAGAGIPGIGILASEAIKSFMNPGLSHESREANEITGLQQYQGYLGDQLKGAETPQALLSLLQQTGGQYAPYLSDLTLGGLDLQSPTTTWDQITKGLLGGKNVGYDVGLGVRPERIAGTEAGFARDLQRQMLGIMAATMLPDAQANPYRQELDRAAAIPGSFYPDLNLNQSFGQGTWADGRYTNENLINPNASPFTGAYGNTFSLQRDFPAILQAALSRQGLLGPQAGQMGYVDPMNPPGLLPQEMPGGA